MRSLSDKNKLFNKESKSNGGKHWALLIFLAVIISIFTVELGIMVSLHRFIPSLSMEAVGLIDSLLLILILFPLLYFLVFRPLLVQMSMRERAEEELKKSHSALEVKVRERTSDLSIANEKLLEANRLKDLFTDVMRHDLLNPAGVIRSATEDKLEDSPEDEELEIIQRNVNKLIEIIENASKLS
jgi:signal transduction histidine kinase